MICTHRTTSAIAALFLLLLLHPAPSQSAPAARAAVARKARPGGGSSKPSGSKPSGGSRPKPRPGAIAGGSLASSGGNEDDDSCFPGAALVSVAARGAVPLSRVSVGDRVLVASGRHSAVYMFSHRVARRAFRFVRLRTARAALVASRGHYVYADGRLVAAGSVRVGSVLQRADGEWEEVVAVDEVLEEGLYNPHTIDGDIVVDGFRVSTYTATVEPVCASALLAPVRAAFRVFGMDVTARSLEEGAPRFVLDRIRRGAAVASQ